MEAAQGRTSRVIETVARALFGKRDPKDGAAAGRYEWAKNWLKNQFYPKSFPGAMTMDQLRLLVRARIAPPSSIAGHTALPTAAQVASIGSCFAEEISKSLQGQGLNAAHISMSERWNTPMALLHFLRRRLRGVPFPEGFIPPDIAETEDKLDMGDAFTAADLFVLTFGLSVCWYSRATGAMALEAPRAYGYAGFGLALKDYEMRQMSAADAEAAILDCIAEVRAARPNARIVLTLSPVPLQAALMEESVVVANTVSKATLRVALHAVMARGMANIFYWPSYEVVNWYGAHIGPPFGGDDRDQRHIRPDLIDMIAAEFKHQFFAS